MTRIPSYLLLAGTLDVSLFLRGGDNNRELMSGYSLSITDILTYVHVYLSLGYCIYLKNSQMYLCNIYKYF